MPFKTLREFIKLEASGGVVLFIAAILALIIDNTSWHQYYEAFFKLHFSVQIGDMKLSKPLQMWINDGLMTIFFLLVGLEIKREMFEGELSSFSKAALPAFAAVGGMLIPGLIYFFLNQGDAVAMRGWAIPTATDIAFSLGILALLGSRLPATLKVFLTALAIFDDIGAIIIIAAFYTMHISVLMLSIAAGCIVVLFIFNRLRIMAIAPYILVGFVLWLCVLNSGVHATLAGIILAFAIPIRDPRYTDISPLRHLEHKLHPWVAFGVLPIFAFANAGVSFAGVTVAEILSPITLGIASGLFFGKQIGIVGFSWLGIKLGLAKKPHAATWTGIYGIGLIAGVGFTMSLFIGTLAFAGQGEGYKAMVRVGVIAGSFLSGLLGYLILRFTQPRHQHRSLMP